MSNCFAMRCPQCGAADRIDIHAAVWVRVTPDGTDADASVCGDHVWCPASPAQCGACGYHGTVQAFTPAPAGGEP